MKRNLSEDSLEELLEASFLTAASSFPALFLPLNAPCGEEATCGDELTGRVAQEMPWSRGAAAADTGHLAAGDMPQHAG